MTTSPHVKDLEHKVSRIENLQETAFTWDYDETRDDLLSLYEKGKREQWSAATRIDWSRDETLGILQYQRIDIATLLERDDRAAQKFDDGGTIASRG